MQATAAVEAAGSGGQYLTFGLDGEAFALGILNIKEIIEVGTVTPVPLMPGFLRGVINLRGAVVPVVDLKARFGKPRTQVARRSCIVIVEAETGVGVQDVGILVDAVHEVLEIPDADIEPPPSLGAAVRPDFIRGMAKVDGRFVILLDPGRVLCVEELGALAGAAATPESAAA